MITEKISSFEFSTERSPVNPKTTAQVTMGIGGLAAVIGGILMAVGTTSVGLFIFYGVIFVAGLGLVTYGKKLLDRAAG